MWCDHPFSQRNRTAEKTVGVVVGGDREVVCVCMCVGMGWTKFEKWGRQYKGGQVFIKQEDQHPSFNYVKRLSKFPILPLQNQPPHSWLPPISISHHPLIPPITTIFEKSHPPSFMKGEGGGGGGLDYVLDLVIFGFLQIYGLKMKRKV